MVDYDTFVREYFPTANASKKSDIKRFLDNVEKNLGGKDLKEYLQNEDFLKSIFYIHKTSGVSRSGYEKIKTYIVCLCHYFEIHPTIPSWADVLNASQKNCYFEDLDAAWNFIDSVGREVFKEYDSHTDLVIIKAIVLLGWHGLSCAEIAEAKKSDIAIESGEHIFKRADNTSFVLTQKEYTILLLLSDLESYRGIPSGRKQILKSDPKFLFRSRLANIRADEYFITQKLVGFNENVPRKYNTCISFRKLRLNALFVYLYENEVEDLPSGIKQFMGCDDIVAYGYRQQYQIWLQTFHNND